MDAWKIPQSSHSRLDRNFLMDALPFAREERISLVKMLFATRQILQTNSKDALVDRATACFQQVFEFQPCGERCLPTVHFVVKVTFTGSKGDDDASVMEISGEPKKRATIVCDGRSLSTCDPECFLASHGVSCELRPPVTQDRFL